MSKSINRAIRHSALAAALGMCLASTAFAQSNTTGTVYGTAQPGTTVTIQNDAGLQRSVVVGADGRFRLPPIPGGEYVVSEYRDNKLLDSRSVTVAISTGQEVNFADGDSNSGTTKVGTVKVTGIGAKIDMSQVDTRTVFTSSQLEKLPVSRDVTAVALLAPSVVVNTSIPAAKGKTSAASFGGSAASENAYYINGFPVTDPLKNIGFNTVPFDSISQMQVLTGGYGAEFGRSTGGVINMITKSGTNEVKGSVGIFFTPASLRSSPKNIYYPNTGAANNATTDGQLYNYREANEADNITFGFGVGGPIIKDRLFFYVSSEYNSSSSAGVGVANGAPQGPFTDVRNGWTSSETKVPRWMAKLDWRINDSNSLEYTSVSDKTRSWTTGYSWNYGSKTHGTDPQSKSGFDEASRLNILKYSGYLTDNLTVNALYGTLKSVHNDLLSTPYRADCPRLSGYTTATNRVPGLTYNAGCQTLANAPVINNFDETKGGRLDLTYTLNNHTFRIGADDMKTHSLVKNEYAGGYVWVYGNTLIANKNKPIDASHGIGAPAAAGQSGDIPGATRSYFVRRQYYTQTADVEVNQRSFYISDDWKITPNLLLSLGVRNESFTNYNGDHLVYIEQKNQWAPRVGLSWDVGGLGTTKVFANAGRYHLAVPNNAAVRGAASSLYTVEYFTYTGVDPVTGAPTGLRNIPVDASLGYTCPGSSTAVSSNLECGTAPDPRTVAAVDIKSHFQDEFILGMEHSFSSVWRGGVKATYRTLGSAIDDTCAPALGGACFMFNPGEDNTFLEDDGRGNLVPHTYTATQLGFPKLERTYTAFDLFLEHGFDNKWYGKLEYTWSRNKGNTEGQLASDLDTGGGNGQSDVGQTQDWDLPQLMVNANGLLPNDRTHQIKGFGYYQLTPEVRLGATLIAASGRPRNCTSWYPTADAGLYNGAYYWFCGLAGDGVKGGSAPSANYAPSPRGSQGTTPWTYQLNLNASYQPMWANRQLIFSVDALNVLDRQTPQLYNPRYASDRNTMSSTYGLEQNFTAPRSVRFSVRYNF